MSHMHDEVFNSGMFELEVHLVRLALRRDTIARDPLGKIFIAGICRMLARRGCSVRILSVQSNRGKICRRNEHLARRTSEQHVKI